MLYANNTKIKKNDFKSFELIIDMKPKIHSIERFNESYVT